MTIAGVENNVNDGVATPRHQGPASQVGVGRGCWTSHPVHAGY